MSFKSTVASIVQRSAVSEQEASAMHAKQLSERGQLKRAPRPSFGAATPAGSGRGGIRRKKGPTIRRKRS